MLSVPAIDAHAHLVDPARLVDPVLATDLGSLRRTFGPDDLIPELAGEGIGGAIVVQLTATLDETRDLLALVAQVPILLGVVGWVDLTCPDVAADIEALRADQGGGWLVGLRHRVHAEPDPGWLGRPDVRRGLAAVEAADLAFDLLVRTRELPAATQLAHAIPSLRLVLDHLARPPIASGDLAEWGRALLTLAECPNVTAKLSGLVDQAARHTWSIDDLRHAVELAVDAFGPERLMLGSDWPICLLAGTYSDAVTSTRILVAELPAHDQADIMGGTAARVYRLDRHGVGRLASPDR
jgi:L-fuconolactonase